MNFVAWIASLTHARHPTCVSKQRNFFEASPRHFENFALHRLKTFPILLLVTMRGDYGEQNPWQYPMGQAVEPVLKALGIQTIRVDREDELESATAAAISAAFKANQGVALILSQKFLGTKEF